MVTLRVNELSKSYASKPVLRNLSFQYSGGVIGIAGPNGSGKSTLMRCLAGLTLPTSGTITWSVNGDEFTNKTIVPKLGYAAPYVQLYDELTVSENLIFIRDIRDSRECKPISDLVEIFGLSEFINSLFGEISSGQQQRAKLAAAAIHRPFILCLDEPGTNLDEAGHLIVKEMTRSFVKSGGMVLLASNQARELELCDHILSVAESKQS